MRRQELEHLIRAAAAITDQTEIMIIGSQSILGVVPEAPAQNFCEHARDRVYRASSGKRDDQLDWFDRILLGRHRRGRRCTDKDQRRTHRFERK